MRLFDHIDLRVTDLSACREFYTGLLPLLGFRLRVEIPGWLQFEGAAGGVTEFFGVTEDPAHKANQTRIAFWAETPAQLQHLAAQLGRLGATGIEGPDWESDSYYAVYFNDPSGNRLEICHRTRKFSG